MRIVALAIIGLLNAGSAIAYDNVCPLGTHMGPLPPHLAPPGGGGGYTCLPNHDQGGGNYNGGGSTFEQRQAEQLRILSAQHAKAKEYMRNLEKWCEANTSSGQSMTTCAINACGELAVSGGVDGLLESDGQTFIRMSKSFSNTIKRGNDCEVEGEDPGEIDNGSGNKTYEEKQDAVRAKGEAEGNTANWKAMNKDQRTTYCYANQSKDVVKNDSECKALIQASQDAMDRVRGVDPVKEKAKQKTAIEQLNDLTKAEEAKAKAEVKTTAQPDILQKAISKHASPNQPTLAEEDAMVKAPNETAKTDTDSVEAKRLQDQQDRNLALEKVDSDRKRAEQIGLEKSAPSQAAKSNAPPANANEAYYTGGQGKTGTYDVPGMAPRVETKEESLADAAKRVKENEAKKAAQKEAERKCRNKPTMTEKMACVSNHIWLGREKYIETMRP